MSTRAIINFTSNEGQNLSVYVHGDGGPRWLGKELGEILDRLEISNGVPSSAKFGEYASTSDDAILQIISLLKGDRVGYVYLTSRGLDPNNASDLWDIDYIYNVNFKSTDYMRYQISVTCDQMTKDLGYTINSMTPKAFLRTIGVWINTQDAQFAARQEKAV